MKSNQLDYIFITNKSCDHQTFTSTDRQGFEIILQFIRYWIALSSKHGVLLGMRRVSTKALDSRYQFNIRIIQDTERQLRHKRTFDSL